MLPASDGQNPGLTKILEAAHNCFATKGFDGTSIQEVARRAGVSKANVFHHFQSKENLYLAVLRRACEGFTDVLDANADADPLTRMEAFVQSHLKSLLERPWAGKLIQRALLEAGDSRGRQLAEQVFAGTFGQVVALVREAQARGQVRTGLDPGLVAFLLIGTGAFFFETGPVLRHLPNAEFAADPASYSRQVFRLLMEGIQ